ncbi:MAG: prepilin-type N-terminal cleavage/methylation domain-containing protein [bacterium]|nr:prepilin-type N-terminal cleavage/methylation domain-containing protein [bacterium]
MLSIKKKNQTRGFSLLEVLIGTTLVGIGVAAIIHSVVSAKFFVKQAELKSRAMNVAFAKMEETLARSYAGLQPGTTQGQADKIDWQVIIRQLDESHGSKQIPYKYIEVSASYQETEPKGGSVNKQVVINNIVPYPFLHTASTSIVDRLTGANIIVPYSSIAAASYKSIGSQGLKITVNYTVPKNIMVIYNLATKIDQATGIGPSDTVLTGCFIDNKGPVPVVTRTPIMSQPLISNAIALTGTDALAPGPHTIEIKWHKDTTAGTISLREANLMLVAVETD